MKLLRQGENECALASIAMLAGLSSMEEARVIAAEVAGKPRKGFQWFPTIVEIGGIGGMGLAMGMRVDLIDQYIAKLCARVGLPPVRMTRCKDIPFPEEPWPDLSGRGHMALWLGIGGHSVAFESGMVYDPDGAPKPMEWGSYLRWRMYGWRSPILAWRVDRLEGERS